MINDKFCDDDYIQEINIKKINFLHLFKLKILNELINKKIFYQHQIDDEEENKKLFDSINKLSESGGHIIAKYEEKIHKIISDENNEGIEDINKAINEIVENKK